MTGSWRKSGGFTFLELTVVVVIIGIVMSITLPRFTAAFSRATLGGTARGLAGTMVYVRDAATRHGRNYFLDVNLDENRYSVAYIDYETDPSEIVYEDPEFLDDEFYSDYRDNIVREIKLQKRIAFSEVVLEDGTRVFDGVARIEFRPDGTADETVIYLTNPKQRIYSVHLERYNGQATVYDYDYTPEPPPVLTEREPPRDLRDAL